MKTETTNTVTEFLSDVEENAILSSEYNPGDNIDLLLEHVVCEMTCGTIEDLWGPVWATFLAVVIDRLKHPVSDELAMSGMKGVLSRMVGHSNVTPVSSMSVNTGLSIGGISSPVDIPELTTEKQLTLASKVCVSLDIATPVELKHLYDALGVGTTPKDAALLYGLKGSDKPIGPHSIPSMMRNLKSRSAFKAVELAAIKTERAAELTKMAVVRCAGDIMIAFRQANSIEQIAEEVNLAILQLQRGATEAEHATAEAVSATIMAEQGFASTMRDITEAHRSMDYLTHTQIV